MVLLSGSGVTSNIGTPLDLCVLLVTRQWNSGLFSTKTNPETRQRFGWILTFILSPDAEINRHNLKKYKIIVPCDILALLTSRHWYINK